MKKTLVAASLALLAMPALAHHSAAMFDHRKTVTVRGTVKQFQYTNPHSWLMVTATGPNGRTTEWAFEAEGPSSLLRAGIRARTFKYGEVVTVTASPMRDGRPAGLLIRVTKADGSVFSPHGPPPSNR